MTVIITPSTLEPLLQLREQYCTAVRAQVVHDSWHRRGRTTLFRIQDQGHDLGYAALGAHPGKPHDTLKEFYLLPNALPRAERLFEAVLTVAQPSWLEAQTNDPFLVPLLDRFAPERRPHTHLFAEGTTSALPAPGVRLRRVTPDDHATVFAHTTEPVGEWGLELSGSLVATGGLFFHYNPPYADVYMEVAPEYRRRGFASYLVQELKRICYESGHVPAARCGLDNPGSRGALERAGMVWCGHIVRGAIAA
jgi:GNAT superfamily N-acetyltransferase